MKRQGHRKIAWWVAASGLVAAVGLVAGSQSGCRGLFKPSAKVAKTTPIASLQSYRKLLVRVDGTQYTRGLTGALAERVQQKVGIGCSFDTVATSVQSPDLILDLNIQRSDRGGGGMINNPNLATIDVLMVLSDGVNDDLLGSAWINGQSSKVAIGSHWPEGDALDAVASKVSQVMNASGCGGPRIARVPDDPPPENTPPPVDGEEPTPEARAEALNDEGKALFRAADVEGAAAKFTEAIALTPDPRFIFNLCFAYETLEQYDRALATCEDALARNPDERLADKTRERMQIIRDKQAGKG